MFGIKLIILIITLFKWKIIYHFIFKLGKYRELYRKENGPQSYVIWEIDKIAEILSKLTITVHPFILAKLS